MNAIIPIPKIPITIRPGTMDDLAFIDALQKRNSKQVGFLHRATLEGKVRLGHVLVAEERDEETERRRDEVEGAARAHSVSSSLGLSVSKPIGYLIGNDQYFKRDDVGAIFQINIVAGKRRSLVGAMLLKAQFERSAYGCKLYCCWCAQDLEANRFWEAMGFVPLAFRAGSEKKARVHIFWQKRIRAGDTTTPWWFPAQTTGGAIREDRLVLPIPPGKTWSDEMPRILPGGAGASPAKLIEQKRGRGSHATEVPKLRQPTTRRVQFGRPSANPEPEPVAKKSAGGTPTPRKKQKNDPKLVAAARELRDRWLEKVVEDPALLESPNSSTAKYEVSRMIAASVTDPPPPQKMLAA